MTYRVTINKETGLGLAENPFAKYDMFSIIINRDSSDFIEFQKENPPLPVFTSDNIQVLDGTWECEKVWQWQDPFELDDNWYDEMNIDDMTTHEYSVSNGFQTRQIYKVVLPVKEEEKEWAVKEIAKQILYLPVTNGQSDKSIEHGAMMIEAYSNYQKQQTIDKVVEIIWSADSPVDLNKLVAKIKELK